MASLRRRRRPAQQLPAPDRYASPGTLARVAVMPLPATPVTADHVAGQAGWAPMPGTPHPSQQIGMYAGTVLTQFPALIPGVQRHSGVEWLTAGYYTPAIYGAAPTQATQQHTALPGAQRSGSVYGGPSGPLNVQANKERLIVAQVRSSGAQVLGWARKLDPTYQEQ